MRIVAALMLVLGLLTACGAETRSAPSGDEVIIDVRTAEEFGQGHLVGARNIDFQSADFDEQIAALPDDVDYIVYCRTGNRSAQAAERMRARGLTVEDLGSLEEAALATGAEVEDDAS